MLKISKITHTSHACNNVKPVVMEGCMHTPLSFSMVFDMLRSQREVIEYWRASNYTGGGWRKPA